MDDLPEDTRLTEARIDGGQIEYSFALDAKLVRFPIAWLKNRLRSFESNCLSNGW